MTRPSSLVTFWALYPWMNPPPRTGISREAGSVTFPAGPALPLPRRRPARAASRAWAFSSEAAAARTRAEPSGGTGRRPPAAAGRPAPLPVARPGPGRRRSPAPAAAGPPRPGAARRPPGAGRRPAPPAGRPPPRPAPRPPVPPAPPPGTRAPRRPAPARVNGSPGSSSPRRPSPNRASSSASAAACRAAISAASFRSPSSVRFASFDAFAAILVPSRATVPDRPMPSRAHRTSTCANSAAAGSGELLPEPGDRHVVRQVPGADHPERHVLLAQPLDPPRGGDPVRVRPDQKGHHHVRVVPCRPRPARPPPRVERRGIQQPHRLDHQPRHVPRRQPVPHVRRKKKRLIPVDRTVTLRHNPILSNTLPAHPGTRNPRSANSATAPRGKPYG